MKPVISEIKKELTEEENKRKPKAKKQTDKAYMKKKKNEAEEAKKKPKKAKRNVPSLRLIWYNLKISLYLFRAFFLLYLQNIF
jgi:hypothetical protein